ncbi:MAG: ankyrin repeat domain-containing protein [Chloroflexota bacterium]
MADAIELIDAVRSGDAHLVVEILREQPELAGARDAKGVSAIMLARYAGDRSITDALLAVDPPLDVFEAAAVGRIDRLGALLDEDASLSRARAPDGFTALHFAAYFGKPTAARVLVDRGAQIDAVAENETQVQPLHSATSAHQTEVCRLLLASGAPVNVAQQGGWTPLHQAAHVGDPELVELFLSAGADPSARAESGETPADMAESAGHPDVATRLRAISAPTAG